MAKSNIKSASPSLLFLNKMLSLFSSTQIKVPGDYVSQVKCIKSSLDNDQSGLVNSLLDFAISAGQVEFSVESSNKTLVKSLNSWIQNINSDLRGKVPTGVKALAKEYYKERWKGSSMIVLRTVWEEKDGFILPTKLWFADGGSIRIEDNSEAKTIGGEIFKLHINREKSIALPFLENERIFIQKPFENWGSGYPTPFLIKRGVYFNMKFIELLNEKGSNVLSKALEYLLLMRKGNEKLASLGSPDFIYSDDDFKAAKKDFMEMVDNMKSGNGTPSYFTGFDTDMSHIIPDYDKILNSQLYESPEKRILSGLGFVEVLEGISGTRKDAVINPRVFISEVQSGVNDFSQLLHDLLMTIIELNKPLRRKLMNSEHISIRTSPVKSFMSSDAWDFLRSLYDRGVISKKTLVELGADIDFEAEVERRKREQDEGVDEKGYPCTMYPPVTQNQETIDNGQPSDNIPDDKKPGTPEAKNYDQSSTKRRR